MKKTLTAALAAIALSACASTPPVTFSYYPVKGVSTVMVTLTVGCNDEGTAVVVLSATPDIKNGYSADASKAPRTIPIDGLDSAFADTDLSISFTEDQRLKGVNVTTTGRGEEIIKSAVNLVGMVAGSGGAGSPPKGGARKLAVCKDIAKLGGGKPVTLLYSTSFDLPVAADPGTLKLKPVPGSQALNDLLETTLNQSVLPFKATVTVPSNPLKAATIVPPSTADTISIKLQPIEILDVRVTANEKAFARFSVVAPSAKDDFEVPVPKAALFGAQTFSLTLSDAGAIATIGYKSSGGAVGALNAAGAITKALEPETTAAKVNEVKAQADLIVQQQRLAACLSNPKACK